MRHALLTNKVSRPGIALTEVRAIIAHWTANYSRGANAMANRNYFNLGSRHASAHYIVDTNEIVKCLPHNEMAYHVGALKYKPFRDEICRGSNPNRFTIGYELCINADGNLTKTIEHSRYLAAWLLSTFNLPIDRLARHFDITGKNCPAFFVNGPTGQQEWEKYKQSVSDLIPSFNEMKAGTVVSHKLNIRAGASASAAILGELAQGERVLFREIAGSNWAEVWPGQYVNKTFLAYTGRPEWPDPL